jgi:Flp pilus assembly pilin Flp
MTSESGQATVELAVILPFIALLLLVVIQVVLIGRSQLVLQNGVREAARQCAVSPNCDGESIVRSHTGLEALVSVTIGTEVQIQATAEVPIIIPGLKQSTSLSVSANAVMRSESN